MADKDFDIHSILKRAYATWREIDDRSPLLWKPDANDPPAEPEPAGQSLDGLDDDDDSPETREVTAPSEPQSMSVKPPAGLSPPAELPPPQSASTGAVAEPAQPELPAAFDNSMAGDGWFVDPLPEAEAEAAVDNPESPQQSQPDRPWPEPGVPGGIEIDLSGADAPREPQPTDLPDVLPIAPDANADAAPAAGEEDYQYADAEAVVDEPRSPASGPDPQAFRDFFRQFNPGIGDDLALDTPDAPLDEPAAGETPLERPASPSSVDVSENPSPQSAGNAEQSGDLNVPSSPAANPVSQQGFDPAMMAEQIAQRVEPLFAELGERLAAQAQQSAEALMDALQHAPASQAEQSEFDRAQQARHSL